VPALADAGYLLERAEQLVVGGPDFQHDVIEIKIVDS
jgi:hypothetical protein